MIIPTEPIGSIPRPIPLIKAVADGKIADPNLDPLYEAAVKDTIERFEATGSPVITDGEQRKFQNFWTYSVHGLANTAPLLPGNVGVYQGAALGALAIAGYSGSHAVAASLMTPLVVTLATLTAALVGLALYGNRVPQLSRAAFRHSQA